MFCPLCRNEMITGAVNAISRRQHKCEPCKLSLTEFVKPKPVECPDSVRPDSVREKFEEYRSQPDAPPPPDPNIAVIGVGGQMLRMESPGNRK